MTAMPSSTATGTSGRPASPVVSRLEARGLQKAYGSRKVVKDVSLAVFKGEVVGLLGPNGAGKTTSFYMLVGLLRSDAGEILLDGQAIQSLPIHRRARLGLGYLPQEASIFRKLSVEDNVRAVLELQHGADGQHPELPQRRIGDEQSHEDIGVHTDHAERLSRSDAASRTVSFISSIDTGAPSGLPATPARSTRRRDRARTLRSPFCSSHSTGVPSSMPRASRMGLGMVSLGT